MARTSLFGSFADLPKEFQEDFLAVWKIEPKHRLELIPHIVQIYQAETTGGARSALEDAATGIPGDKQVLLRALKALYFVYKTWDILLDSPDQFLADLVDLGLLPSDSDPSAKHFLVEFLGQIQKDNERRLGRSFAQSVVPNYIGAEAVVDFRAVIAKPFGLRGLSDIEKYEPACIALVPVVLMKIKRDVGDPVVLQFEEKDLEAMTKILRAAQKDLAAGRVSLPRGDR